MPDVVLPTIPVGQASKETQSIRLLRSFATGIGSSGVT